MVKVTDTKTQSLNVNHGIWQVYVCIFNCHFIHFLLAKNKYGAIDVETVFNSILTDYRKNELRIILERMISLNDFTFEDINSIIPDKFQKDLLSPDKWLL